MQICNRAAFQQKEPDRAFMQCGSLSFRFRTTSLNTQDGLSLTNLFMESSRFCITNIIGHKMYIFHLAGLSCTTRQINNDKMPDGLKNNSLTGLNEKFILARIANTRTHISLCYLWEDFPGHNPFASLSH